MRQFCIAVCFTVICGFGTAGIARSDDGEVARTAAPRPVVAVAEFTGDDAATARFIADALLTDLAQSRDMRLVERSEIQRARTELKLKPNDPYEDQTIRTLGRMVRADRLIVGSYLVRGDEIIVNARLMDVSSGRLVEGAGANVTGDSHSLLPVVHRLAHLLHRKVTGADIVIDGEGAEPPSAANPLPVRRADQTNAAQPSRYRVGQPSNANDPGNGSRSSAPNGNSEGYRATESADSPPQQIVQPPVNVTVVPPPVVYPTYVPYYVPYYDYYPFFSFSFSTFNRLHFSHFGRSVHFGGRRFR